MLTVFFVLWGVCAFVPLVADADDLTFAEWAGWTIVCGIFVAAACGITAAVR